MAKDLLNACVPTTPSPTFAVPPPDADDACSDVPTSWMTQACSTLYVESSGMANEICLLSAEDGGGCKRSCCEAGLYDVFNDDCSACDLNPPDPEPMPEPEDTQCATDARICTDLRNGLQPTATNVCIGPPEAALRPCYPVQGGQQPCSGDMLECTPDNAGEIAHHEMVTKIVGDKRVSGYRCAGGPEGPLVGPNGQTYDGAWGKLGGPPGTMVTEATCHFKCLGRKECKFAIWRRDENNPTVGACTSFASCDGLKDQSDEGLKYTVWEKRSL
jgi:hypothetical protein